MKFRITVNFTNLTGAIALFASMKMGADILSLMIWPAVVMVLGRAVIPELTKLAEVVLSLKNKGG